jgi:hypothetical protein
MITYQSLDFSAGPSVEDADYNNIHQSIRAVIWQQRKH